MLHHHEWLAVGASRALGDVQVIGAPNVQNGTLAPRSGLGKDARCTGELKGRGTTPLPSLHCILQDVGSERDCSAQVESNPRL